MRPSCTRLGDHMATSPARHPCSLSPDSGTKVQVRGSIIAIGDGVLGLLVGLPFKGYLSV